MTNLDDIAAMQRLDPMGVLESTALFPDQCEQAWREASAIQFPASYQSIDAIVVCGMGGSRFTPRAIKELYRDRIKKPYEIVEDYTLPSYVTSHTLVILSSYSGTTEEVISCGQDAKKRGAKVTAVSQKAIAPVGYFFNPKHNPCGQPRIGGGYMLMGHLGILAALHLVDIEEHEVLEAISHSRDIGMRCAPTVPIDTNPAKQLAITLKDTHPFIVTSEFLRGFGNGFANQINETAKTISDPRTIPELNHHLMEGLKRPETLRQNSLFLFFESDLYSDPIRKRYRITKEVVEKQQVKTHRIKLQGQTKGAQVLEAFTLSGFTTFYMAMLSDIDPVAIPWVDYFKRELAKTP